MTAKGPPQNNQQHRGSDWGFEGKEPDGGYGRVIPQGGRRSHRAAKRTRMHWLFCGGSQGVSIGGVGTSRVKPQTTVFLTVYKNGEKKPVLRAVARGAKTKDAIKADFGSSDDTQEWTVLLESIDLGVTKIVEKFGA